MNGVPLGGQFYVPTVAVAQPERARRLQSRPGRVPGRLVRHPRQPQRSTRCGDGSSASARSGAPLFTGRRLLHRRAGRRRQRRARHRRRLRHRLAALPRRLQPDRPPTADIVAQLVDLNGALVGGPLRRRCDDHWQREPSVAYSPGTDSFMVAWGATTTRLGPGAVHVRTVAASTGALGTAARDRHGHRRLRAAARVQRRHAASSSSPGTRSPTSTAARSRPTARRSAASRCSPSTTRPTTGSACPYNPVADAYFAVFHGRGREDAGAQISAAGAPDVEFDVTADAGGQRQLQPAHHVSTSSRREWLSSRRSIFGLITGAARASRPAARRRPRRRRHRRLRRHRRRRRPGIELTGAERAERQLVLRRRRGIGRGERVPHVLPGPEPEPGERRRCGVFYASDDGRLIVKTVRGAGAQPADA